jgi:hypothetical protein
MPCDALYTTYFSRERVICHSLFNSLHRVICHSSIHALWNDDRYALIHVLRNTGLFTMLPSKPAKCWVIHYSSFSDLQTALLPPPSRNGEMLFLDPVPWQRVICYYSFHSVQRGIHYSFFCSALGTGSLLLFIMGPGRR